MFRPVYIEDVGNKLIDGHVYVCRSGNETFKARFNYCPDEYWWTRIDNGKLTCVREYDATKLTP